MLRRQHGYGPCRSSRLGAGLLRSGAGAAFVSRAPQALRHASAGSACRALSREALHGTSATTVQLQQLYSQCLHGMMFDALPLICCSQDWPGRGYWWP